MKYLKLKNQELWYTDDPLGHGNLDRISELRGTKSLRSIIVYASDLFVEIKKGFTRKYIIVDGNTRAFIDSEEGKESRGRLLETDSDLISIIGELHKGHSIIDQNITSLHQLREVLHDSLRSNCNRNIDLFYGKYVA